MAATQKLPDGTAGMATAVQEGVCHVCNKDTEYDRNQMLQCDGCRMFVHMDCYGVSTCPDGRLWLCDICRLGKSPGYRYTFLQPSRWTQLREGAPAALQQQISLMWPGGQARES